jgi:hypothetical protein
MLTAHWHTMSRFDATTQGHTLVIYFATPGYCVGEPRYALDHVKIVERPRTGKRPFGSAVITPFLFRPAFERVVPGREGNVIYGVCADIGGGRAKLRVRLKRPANRLIFYDGSFDNPHRVYPPVGTPPKDGGSRGVRRRKADRAALKNAIRNLADPAKVCAQLTEAFLSDTYGADGRPGRKLCQGEVRRGVREGEHADLDRYRILRIHPGRARAWVKDSDGNTAIFTFVKRPRGWLVLEVDGA